MITVKHRFLGRDLAPDTKTLIIGTFNPDTPANEADFFYGRSRNHLWKLLPTAFGTPTLKAASKQEKMTFINQHHIDFIDIINEVQVEEGQETNYADDYLDDKVVEWNPIIEELPSLNNLQRVCFTRKTFAGVPNIKQQVDILATYFDQRNIPFVCLLSPARIYSQEKQKQWTQFLLNH